MKKKITIKDIAKEAGVSVATVSYVLNNRTEERISDDTRKKVLQIVNLLNYTPNQSAKALATSKSQNIAVYLSPGVAPMKRAEQLHFLNMFSTQLHKNNYNLMHLCPEERGPMNHVDAVVCYDASLKDFYKIGDSIFIPLLAVNSRTEDPMQIFFQVSTDFRQLQLQAQHYFHNEAFILASLDIINENEKKELEAAFLSVKYVSTLADLELLKGKNVAVYEDSLYHLLDSCCNLFYSPSITTEKLAKIIQCMELAINRIPVEQHSFLL